MPSRPYLFERTYDGDYARSRPTQVGMMRGCRLQSPDRAPRGLPGSSDVICGIGATAPGVRPQPKRRSSTADRAPKLLILRTNRSRIRAGRVRRTEFAPGEPDRPPQSLISRKQIAQIRSGDIGTCRIPMMKVLAGVSAIRHSSLRPLIPGGRCSQGGVKVPTGGKGWISPSPRAPSSPGIPLWNPLGKKGQQIRCDSEADG